MYKMIAGIWSVWMLIMGTALAAPPENPKPGDRVMGQYFETRSPVLARNGMAATAQPLASQIAIDVLKKGGSAVDAAIAANASLGLMEPVANGIGGDLFAIVWDPKTKKLYGLNGSGRSPKGQTLAELRAKLNGKDHIPPYGSLPASVPGTVDAWFELHEKFGKLPMSEVLAPAVHEAREGFPVTKVIAWYWQRSIANFEKQYKAGNIEEIDNAMATYTIDGKAPVAGQVFKNPNLANTLETIARDGRDVFYKGKFAHQMDAYFKRIGGPLRYEDFASHHSQWVEPVSVNYRGYDVWELPPNGQGIAALQMLQILKGFDMKKAGFLTAESLHLQVEAKRLAFADRAQFYADPDFINVPVEELLSDAYAAKRRALIMADKAMPSIGPGDPQILEDGDTTYLTVADKDGMMVSLIQSNYRGMGSGLVADDLGFMFQDRGELFSLTAGHANVYAPGKRPFHTIIPAFISKEGKPLISFGLMGGAMQPQGHVQIVLDLVDYGLGLQEAGDAARWRHAGSAQPTGEAEDGVGILHLENGVPEETRKGLESMGYKLGDNDGSFGGYQAIWRDPETGVYHGASEMRKDGAAIGY